MNINEIQSLAEEIHSNAVEKGFWEGDRNLNEARMLIITELAEAVEAHREDRYAAVDQFKDELKRQDEWENLDKDFPSVFKMCIKDTIEDELADAYIRILDLLFYEYQGDIKKAWDKENVISGTIFTNNFAETIYNISKHVYTDLAMTSFVIECYCMRLGIDLKWHVHQKMKYNATREKMHNKKY